MVKQLTAIIEKEDDGYVALCPEVDVASQGDTVGDARANLIEVNRCANRCVRSPIAQLLPL